MSYDLYFWPAGCTDDPRRLARQLAHEHPAAVRPDTRVLAFRADVLHSWPELTDTIGPWHDDLGWRQPWGRTDLADRFAKFNLPYTWDHAEALVALAGVHGLDCYDPQTDELFRPARTAVEGPTPRPHQPEVASRSSGHSSASVNGQVSADQVVRLLEQISRHIGYAYDDLDEAALSGALEDTNDESADAWFTYPLQGIPPLTVHLARSSSGGVLGVRVEGDIDQLLAARIATLLNVL